MDEFDKIQEVSDDIVGRKEPAFQNGSAEEPEVVNAPNGDEAEMYHFAELEKEANLDEMMRQKNVPFRGHLWAIGAFVVILAVAVSAFLFTGDKTETGEIITIAATPTPVRVKPENPGGMKILDQDKLIYNVINSNTVPTKVENLFPEPEKPVLPDILAQKETTEEPYVAVEKVAAIDPLKEARPVVIEEVPPEPKKEALTLPKKAVVAATPKADKNKPIWRVQLLSSGKKATAEKAWAMISKKHKALLSDMSHEIAVAKIAGKGTFYRLQAGHFATRDMAAGLCVKLKAQKQECVPVKVEAK